MTGFDLLFIAMFIATVVLVVFAGVAAISGRRARAVALLVRLCILVAVYLGIVIVVSLVSPRRVLDIGDEQCSDDWYIAVTNVRRDAGDNAEFMEVTFRLSSRARRRAQRERGVYVYLMDDLGRCYDPVLDSAAIPFDVLLQPQESVNAARRFLLPADAHGPVLVVAHTVWFPGIFIIGGSESLFHKRTVVRLE